MITSLLILLCIGAFGLAYYFRDKHFSPKIYDAITCFSASLIIGIVLFDFLPHQFADFLLDSNSEHMHDGHCTHDQDLSASYTQYLVFGGLVLGGLIFQVFLERMFHFKFSNRFENGMLVLGLFLHSFSEVSVLFDAQEQLNKALFTGILFHKLPISFVLAYTLLSRTSFKKSAIWFSVFLISVPLGMICNSYMHQFSGVFNLVSIFVSGMMLHVVWHILGGVKTNEKLNITVLVLGAILAYCITLFHAH